jgi:hypothetical protein
MVSRESITEPPGDATESRATVVVEPSYFSVNRWDEDDERNNPEAPLAPWGGIYEDTGDQGQGQDATAPMSVPGAIGHTSHYSTGDFRLRPEEETAVLDRLRRRVPTKRTTKQAPMIETWISFLEGRAYTEEDDKHVLEGFLRESKLKLLVLFVMHLEDKGKSETEVTTHLRALRVHFLINFGDHSIFDDKLMKVLREKAESGREASYRKEGHLRLPTPAVFIPWLRENYYVPGMANDDAGMMMTYIGNACAYDKGMRCSEYAHSDLNEEGEHAIRAEDVYFEAHEDGDLLKRYLPHDFSRFTPLPCCTSTEAKDAKERNQLKGGVRYYAVRKGFRRGVLACIHEYRASILTYPGGEGKVFSNRAKAAEYCINEDIDRRPQVDTSSIERIHMLIRSAKNSRDGTIRRLVFQRTKASTGQWNDDAEGTLVGDIIEFVKAANFTEQDGTRQFLSREKNKRVLKLNRHHVSQSLKDAAVHFGLDPEFFSSHCHRIAAASALSQAGYGDEDIRRFIGWVGKSSQLYERDFKLRPSTLRLLEQGYAVSLQDAGSMVPPRAHARTTAVTKTKRPPAAQPRQPSDATVHAQYDAPVSSLRSLARTNRQNTFGRIRTPSLAATERDITEEVFGRARSIARRHSIGGSARMGGRGKTPRQPTR